jgi:hypothetical protein
VSAGIALLGVFSSLVRGKEQGQGVAGENAWEGEKRWR